MRRGFLVCRPQVRGPVWRYLRHLLISGGLADPANLPPEDGVACLVSWEDSPQALAEANEYYNKFWGLEINWQ